MLNIPGHKDRTDPFCGVGTNEMTDYVGKECRRLNMVQILCTHACKWKKMRSVETTSGMGERRRRMVKQVNSTIIHC
jgi:hypothetical protein